MTKWNKLFILGGILFSFSQNINGEIKEVKLLEDFSNEIIGTNEKEVPIKAQTTNTVIKSIDAVKKENKIEQKKEGLSSSMDVEKVESPVSINKKIDINSIVDIYEKRTENGIAYKKGEDTRFTGYFGAVIDGNVDYIESYKDGLLDGESAWFSRKGIKLLSENYSKGKLHGDQSSYYDNGQLKSVVKYVNGRVDGIIAYDKNGKILHQSIFKNGTGAWKFYWSNGKLSEEGAYVSGRKDGVWKKYREDGSIDVITTYNNGRLLSERWN